MNFDNNRAEHLTKLIMERPNSPQVGVLANDLLREYHRGYPVENLRPLLSHDNQDVVKTGAFIASELGMKGSPLLADIAHLIAHPQKNVRFYAIDCLLIWAGRPNKAEIASVFSLFRDPEPGVRWKVLDFLSRATGEQLDAALSALEASEPNSANVRGLRWLIDPRTNNPQEVQAVLQSQDKILRKFGVVAARRMSKSDRRPLSYAASLDDPDVRNFADSSLKLL